MPGQGHLDLTLGIGAGLAHGQRQGQFSRPYGQTGVLGFVVGASRAHLDGGFLQGQGRASSLREGGRTCSQRPGVKCSTKARSARMCSSWSSTDHG